MDIDAFNSERETITVLIAVAVRLYRDGLAMTLGAQERLRVVGTAATSSEAITAFRQIGPEVVIVDVSFDDVLDLMRALREGNPCCRIVALAVREEITTILDYAEAGADGFVVANASVAELVEAIMRTAAGELLCSPRIAAQLLRRAAHTPAAQLANVHALTRRELQVLSLLRQGKSNKQIASSLNIAEATVKNHVHHLLEKLQVATRGQAVAVAAPPLNAVLAQTAPAHHVG